MCHFAILFILAWAPSNLWLDENLSRQHSISYFVSLGTVWAIVSPTVMQTGTRYIHSLQLRRRYVLSVRDKIRKQIEQVEATLWKPQNAEQPNFIGVSNLNWAAERLWDCVFVRNVRLKLIQCDCEWVSQNQLSLVIATEDIIVAYNRQQIIDELSGSEQTYFCLLPVVYIPAWHAH